MRIKIIYRRSLKMTEGKLSSQVAHVAKNLPPTPRDINIVVLGMSDNKFNLTVQEHDCYIQYDKGLTEVSEGTPTAAGWIEE